MMHLFIKNSLVIFTLFYLATNLAYATDVVTPEQAYNVGFSGHYKVYNYNSYYEESQRQLKESELQAPIQPPQWMNEAEVSFSPTMAAADAQEVVARWQTLKPKINSVLEKEQELGELKLFFQSLKNIAQSTE